MLEKPRPHYSTIAVIELLNASFKALVLPQGKIAGLAVSGKRGSLSEEARGQIMKADRNALAEANRRYAIIKPVLEGHRPADTTTPARTIRDWAAKYRKADYRDAWLWIRRAPVELPPLWQSSPAAL